MKLLECDAEFDGCAVDVVHSERLIFAGDYVAILFVAIADDHV